jgi:hypothetical protein
MMDLPHTQDHSPNENHPEYAFGGFELTGGGRAPSRPRPRASDGLAGPAPQIGPRSVLSAARHRPGNGDL